ncbi:MAG: C25 family cysteine peptidase, partial [Anaerolineales bacterium]
EASSSSGRAGQNGSLLPSARLGYFNLHGLADAPEWYGQREAGSNGLPGIIGDGEDYPVAVRPSDVMNSGRAPQIVFSEACYGAHILDKTPDEALALKFLQAGTQAVVGSTCISYGAISPPLIAADFLGHAFWTYLREGLPAGEALRRARIALAREMHTRQGYLDGEDQKTLISFVLYGDPLAMPVGLEFSARKFHRPAKPPANIKTVCDLAHAEEAKQPVPQEILDYVKNVVEQYLPGMAGSQLTLSYEHVDCDAIQPKQASGTFAEQPVDHLTAQKPYQLARKVVTLSKDIPNSTHLHHHYARLTLDAQGKLVKLAVSR